MKALALMTAGAAILMLAGTAHAGNARLTSILKATTEDYETIKSSFMDARGDESVSWDDYRKTIGAVMARVAARRAALDDFNRQDAKGLPAGQRALVRMMVRDLDDINLSLLALVWDERGHAGYLKTGDEELIKGIYGWQEGIRLAIRQAGRCIKLAGRITFPVAVRPRFIPVPSH